LFIYNNQNLSCQLNFGYSSKKRFKPR
jgi:hypothetical protein